MNIVVYSFRILEFKEVLKEIFSWFLFCSGVNDMYLKEIIYDSFMFVIWLILYSLLINLNKILLFLLSKIVEVSFMDGN